MVQENNKRIEYNEYGHNEEGVPYVEGLYFHDEPFKLKCGKEIPLRIKFTMYGDRRKPAIFVPSTLTSNLIAHGDNPKGVSSANGWWASMVGPGKALDTNRYCIIGMDWVGGCFGSTGPGDINPATGKEYEFDFPKIDMRDNVRAQKLCMDALGIPLLAGVCSGSLGAMCAQLWKMEFPKFAGTCFSLAGTWGHREKDLMGGHDYERGLATFLYNTLKPDLGKERASQIALKAMRGHAVILYQTVGASNKSKEIVNLPDTPEVMRVRTSTASYAAVRGYQREPAVNFASHCYILDMNSEYGIANLKKRITQDMIDKEVPKLEELNQTSIGCAVNLDKKSREYILRIMMGLKQLGPDRLREALEEPWCIFSYGGDSLYNPQRAAELAMSIQLLGGEVSFYHLQGKHGHDGFAEAKAEVTRRIVKNLVISAQSRWPKRQEEVVRQRNMYLPVPF